jgi:hypothetical protein
MLPFVLLLVHTLLFAASAGAPLSIFDGRVPPKRTSVAPEDLSLLRSRALPAARKAAGKECEEAFEILGVVTGGFTRAGVDQRIFLYKYCETARAVGRGGLAVIEGEELVQHLAFVGGGEDSLGILPDMNGDSLAELVIVSSVMGQGEMAAWATFLSWSPAGLKNLGKVQVLESDCGMEDGGTNVVSHVFAIPGPEPTLLEQRYTGSCKGKKWTKKGTRQQAALWQDETTYQVLTSPRSAHVEEGGASGEKPAPIWTNRRHRVLEHLLVVDDEVIGGWSQKGWTKINHKQLVPKGVGDVVRAVIEGLVKKGTKLRLFKKQRRMKTVTLDNLTFVWDGAGNQYVLAPAAKGAEVSLTGAWDPFPRKVRKVGKERFLSVVVDLLKAQSGPPKGKPEIERVEEVDLDNDGANDFLVMAKGKDFWLAALVWSKPDGERVELVRLVTSDVPTHGEVMVLDANGDGKLELLLKAHVGGDVETELYELQADGKPKQVLFVWNGC